MLLDQWTQKKDFHQKRMGYVKYCIHMRRNIPLTSISLNWTSKHVSVKGQIVVKTSQNGSLKYIKYQDIEPEVEDQMEKWQSKKTHRNDCEQSRDGPKTQRLRKHYEKSNARQHKKIKKATEAQVKVAADKKLKKVDGDFPACMRRENSNNENNTRRNEDLKGKGGSRLKHYNVDGYVPLCLRNFDGKKRQ